MIPKILHLYWGADKPLSYLRWLTVSSFAELNPSWEVMVWHPRSKGDRPKWDTKEHTHFKWQGEDWFQKLPSAGPNVSINEAPIDDYPSMTEVHRSDLLRWQLMATIGGFWSDFDILYFRPMEAANLDYSASCLLSWGEIPELKKWQAIGFLAGAPKNPLFTAMVERGLDIAKNEASMAYQQLGSDLLNHFCPAGTRTFKRSRIGQIKQAVVYPFHSVVSEMPGIWDNWKLLDIQPCTIGIHWFAAQKKSAEAEAKIKRPKDIENLRGQGGIKMAKARQIQDGAKTIKYSIIIPYMDRLTVFNNTLVSYLHWYEGREDYEVIVVQDSKTSDRRGLNRLIESFVAKGLNISTIKVQANNFYNPAPLFNAGVAAAKGEFIILTSPEIFHGSDVLTGLDAEFNSNSDAYVVCACAAHDKPNNEKPLLEYGQLNGKFSQWYQHSQERPARYHFCAALKKSIYLSIGGFDDQYAEGYCFDDDDWRDTVIGNGIPIVERDDLLTIHQHHEHLQPPNKMDRWYRNKAIYEKKFGTYAETPPAKTAKAPVIMTKAEALPIRIACVLKSGGRYTKEHVQILHDSLKRNISKPFEFAVFTDTPIDGINNEALKLSIPGWWSKVEIFRSAGPCLYIDLDTVIISNLDSLIDRVSRMPFGEIRMLTPFNQRRRRRGLWASGIMAWHGNFAFLYRKMDQHYRRVFRGDQDYITHMLKDKATISAINEWVGVISYKRDVLDGVPLDVAEIVCFHGEPSPADVVDLEWVKDNWRLGV